MTEILIVYYSRHGATAELARHAARGVESVAGCTATLRTVPPVSAESERPVQAGARQRRAVRHARRPAPRRRIVVRQPDALRQHGGAAQVFSRRHFEPVARRNARRANPPAVFSASQTMHGGQESTLLTMALPLLHHGMLLRRHSRSPNAASTRRAPAARRMARPMSPASRTQPGALSDDEIALAQALGKRVAEVAATLAAGRARARK